MTEKFLIMFIKDNMKKVYINKENKALLFIDKDMVEDFLNHSEKTLEYLDLSSGFHSMKDILSLCYKSGAKELEIISDAKILNEDGSYSEATIESLKEDLGRTSIILTEDILPGNLHFNNVLNNYLYFYKASEDEKYLKKLKDCFFISACKIRNNEDRVIIEYLTALTKLKDKNGKRIFAYILFSDLMEYKLWMTKRKSEISNIKGIKPLELSINELLKINKGHGFVINPGPDNIYIDGEKFEKIFSNNKKEKV